MYRVKLRSQTPVRSPGERPMNPFLIHDIFNMPPVTYAVRVFEFEAKDEDEVRRLLDEARKEGIENVRGFDLWKIEQIEAQADG